MPVFWPVMVCPLPSRVMLFESIWMVSERFWVKVQVLVVGFHVPICEQSPPVGLSWINLVPFLGWMRIRWEEVRS